MTRLLQLLKCGQSYWLDNLSRAMIRSGEHCNDGSTTKACEASPAKPHDIRSGARQRRLR